MGNCLICGISRAEVNAVRNREGYTLGCGIESNTEAGFDYDELSPRHRWRPWKDSELTLMGIKPEVVDHYRTAQEIDILYAPCEDTVQGHKMITEDDAFLEDIGGTIGTCVFCGEEA